MIQNDLSDTFEMSVKFTKHKFNSRSEHLADDYPVSIVAFVSEVFTSFAPSEPKTDWRSQDLQLVPCCGHHSRQSCIHRIPGLEGICTSARRKVS